MIEKQTKSVTKDKVSLAPVKSSELAPAQVGNEKSSDLCPAQTGTNLLVRSTDFIENQIDLEGKDDSALAQVGNKKSNVQFSDQMGKKSSVLATDIMENQMVKVKRLV